MSMESTQVRLRLTQKKEVLKEMKRRKSLKQDSRGDKVVVQYDGQEFVFRPGMSITVGRLVANALKRSASIIMGDDLTGPVECELEELGTFQLGEEAREEGNKLTLCPVCKKDLHSLSRLARHINVAHKTERPDLYEEKAQEKGKTDWDTPIEDPEVEQLRVDDEDEGEESADVNEAEVAG